MSVVRCSPGEHGSPTRGAPWLGQLAVVVCASNLRYGALGGPMASKIGRLRCSSGCEPPRSLGRVRAP